MSQCDSSVKLDKLGEAQQMLVMLSIMKEIMKPLEKPTPVPVPRPLELSTLERNWFEENIGSWFARNMYDERYIGNVESHIIEEMQSEIYDIEQILGSKLD